MGCCEGEEGRGVWPVIWGVTEPSFSAVGTGMAACASPGGEEGGNPHPLLLAERRREVFALVTRTAGAEDRNDMTGTGRL